MRRVGHEEERKMRRRRRRGRGRKGRKVCWRRRDVGRRVFLLLDVLGDSRLLFVIDFEGGQKTSFFPL